MRKNWNRWGVIKQMETNKLMMNRKKQIWAREEGKHETWGTQVWHYSPLPNGASRTVHPPTGRGGGRSGGLKGHGDRTRQEASRAAPVPGPKAERGARVAMAGQWAREAMVDQGIWGAMADPGTQAAMAEQEFLAAMADQGSQAAMVEQESLAAMADPPLRPWPQPPPRPLRLVPY